MQQKAADGFFAISASDSIPPTAGLILEILQYIPVGNPAKAGLIRLDLESR